MFVVIGLMALPGSNGCSSRRRQNLTDTRLLQLIRQQYIFVENKLVTQGSNSTQLNGRSNFVTGAIEGTTKCPWKWATDDDPDRIPRYIAKAVCPSANITAGPCSTHTTRWFNDAIRKQELSSGRGWKGHCK